MKIDKTEEKKERKYCLNIQFVYPDDETVSDDVNHFFALNKSFDGGTNYGKLDPPTKFFFFAIGICTWIIEIECYVFLVC
jgi:hypothetical protein